MAARKSTEIANQIRRNIVSGRYGTEGGLPESRELAEKYEVATNTIVAALANLEGQGLIEKRGHSYYVNQVSIQMTQYVSPVAVRMRVLNRSGFIRNVGEVERTTLPSHLAYKANLEEASSVHQVCVMGEMANEAERPMQLSHYYFLLPVSDEQIDQLQNNAAFDPLLDGAPVHLTRHDEITSRIPTQEEAEMLNLPSGAASAIAVLSIVRDTSGKIFLIQEDIFSPRTTFVYDYTFENRPKTS